MGALGSNTCWPLTVLVPKPELAMFGGRFSGTFRCVVPSGPVTICGGTPSWPASVAGSCPPGGGLSHVSVGGSAGCDHGTTRAIGLVGSMEPSGLVVNPPPVIPPGQLPPGPGGINGTLGSYGVPGCCAVHS